MQDCRRLFSDGQKLFSQPLLKTLYFSLLPLIREFVNKFSDLKALSGAHSLLAQQTLHPTFIFEVLYQTALVKICTTLCLTSLTMTPKTLFTFWTSGALISTALLSFCKRASDKERPFLRQRYLSASTHLCSCEDTMLACEVRRDGPLAYHWRHWVQHPAHWFQLLLPQYVSLWKVAHSLCLSLCLTLLSNHIWVEFVRPYLLLQSARENVVMSSQHRS